MGAGKNQPDIRAATTRLFLEIQSAFPHLKMHMDTHHPHVEIIMDIPKQQGLRFDVNLNLQNHDELHLSTGHFWLEWFPCTDEETMKAYREAVHGVLSGRFRILEYYRGSRAVMSQLQMPDGQGWKTIGMRGDVANPLGHYHQGIEEYRASLSMTKRGDS